MYATNARKALLAVLKEAPEMKALKGWDAEARKKGPSADTILRQLTDRVLMELWMRGFAVSARQLKDRSPTGERVDPAMHDAWRKSKSKTLKDGQTDVGDRKTPASA